MSERYTDWGGQLIHVGRFEWERVVRQCVFPKKYTKLVAFVLATYADTKTGMNVRPGQKRLAIHAGISDRAVRDHLRDLEEFGLIKLLITGSSFGRSGKGMATIYQLTMPEQLDAWIKTADDSLDVWDFDILNTVRAVEDQWKPASADKSEERKLASADSEPEWTVSPEVADISPEVNDISPEVNDKNTGSQLPPTSSLPPHESNPHQSNLHASSSPSVTHAREGAREKSDALIGNLSLNDERNRQSAGLKQRMAEYEKQQGRKAS
ncbi:hypothetical protein [Paenarthrobacter sp. CAP02]|uniref:hypothetical protein n=1 Tax=Paenarthrobacter sp. CAP02 TaxID=3158144 RepID=UPI0032DAC19F